MVSGSDLQKNIFKGSLSHAIALDVHLFEVLIQRLEKFRILVTKVVWKLENQFIYIIDFTFLPI